MSDAKPTGGLNEEKPYSTSDFEDAIDLHGLRRMQEEIDFQNRDGPITPEWLIEKWGYYYEFDDDEVINNTLRNFTRLSFRIKQGDPILRCFGNEIVAPPKTRDEFRLFAKFFGLKEKQG